MADIQDENDVKQETLPPTDGQVEASQSDENLPEPKVSFSFSANQEPSNVAKPDENNLSQNENTVGSEPAVTNELVTAEGQSEQAQVSELSSSINEQVEETIDSAINNSQTDVSDSNTPSATEFIKDEKSPPQNLMTLLNRKKKANVRPYDLKARHNSIPERFAALEIVNERFSRQFRVGLFNRIRRNIDVIAHPIKLQTFRDFSQEATASHLNLVNLHPLRGASLFLFSSDLISSIVSNLFGSEGRFASVKIDEDREFTLTEQQVIKRILQLILGIYQTAWSDIYQIEVEYVRSEMQIRFTNITNSADDIVLTSEFTVEIDGLISRFCVCIPYDSVEPIKDALVTPPIVQKSSDSDKEWRSSLTTGIKHSTVEIVANFAKVNSTVNKVIALKIDDILPIEKPDILNITIGNVPVLTGQFGKSNKQYAIQVENLIGSALDQINEDALNDGRFRNKR